MSIATVSRVVNGNGKIRTETAKRVQTAVEDLGFRPNAVGRGLKTARTQTLGILLPSLSNPIFAEVAEGAQERARAAGYSVFITCNNYDPAVEYRAVETMLSHRVEALILTVADAESNKQLDRLRQEGIPHVLLFNQPSNGSRSVVAVDNVAAGRLVVEEFMQLGHKRLGMIAGRFVTSDRSRARCEGFVFGAAARGLSCPQVIEVDFVEGRVASAIAQLFTGANVPTGLFCSTDLLAISVMSALRDLGLRVPEDVSVIGFDGISFGLHCHPTLATVVQPSRDMGRTAVQHLLERLNNNVTTEAYLLPTIFRNGGSLGPVPSKKPS